MMHEIQPCLNNVESLEINYGLDHGLPHLDGTAEEKQKGMLLQ